MDSIFTDLFIESASDIPDVDTVEPIVFGMYIGTRLGDW